MSDDGSVKKLRCIQRSADRHWVGNGFPVRTLFAYPNLGPVLSPFLLLDYAGPMDFAPTTERRGVGEHPHRGFETVTIVYEGEVGHRDSSAIIAKFGGNCAYCKAYLAVGDRARYGSSRGLGRGILHCLSDECNAAYLRYTERAQNEVDKRYR